MPLDESSAKTSTTNSPADIDTHRQVNQGEIASSSDVRLLSSVIADEWTTEF